MINKKIIGNINVSRIENYNFLKQFFSLEIGLIRTEWVYKKS